MLDQTSLIQSPFAGLTFIAAPAILTNACSVLAMSTINRMLRTRDMMQELYARSEKGGLSNTEAEELVEQVDRVEKQAILMLAAMRFIYVALAAFSAATVVTLLGIALASLNRNVWFAGLAGLGLGLGFVGLVGLVLGSANLLRATQLSLIGARQEANRIRERQRFST
jgi:hypothetical protein